MFSDPRQTGEKTLSPRSFYVISPTKMLNRGSVVPFFPSRASRCIVAAPGKPASLRKVVTSSAVAPPFRDSSSASSFPAADASAFVIRPPRTDDEFYSIAELRAEAYYAVRVLGWGRRKTRETGRSKFVFFVDFPTSSSSPSHPRPPPPPTPPLSPPQLLHYRTSPAEAGASSNLIRSSSGNRRRAPCASAWRRGGRRRARVGF